MTAIEGALVSRFMRMRTHGSPLVVAIRGIDSTGTRHNARIRRGFHDVMVVYPIVGSPYVMPASTTPWQPREWNDRNRRPAVYLEPGHYAAVPNLTNENGQTDPRGRLTFQIADPATGQPINYGTGTVGLYPEPHMSPHVGCQTIPPGQWPRFLRSVGGGRAPFAYVVVDASIPPPRLA